MNKYLEYNDNKTIIKKDDGIESINSTVFLENYNRIAVTQKMIALLDGVRVGFREVFPAGESAREH